MSVIAVTGASGTIGAPLVRALIRAGHQVRGLSRRPRDPQPSLEWIRGDVLDSSSLDTLVRGAQLVIHAAGQLDGDANTVRRSLVDGTANVLRAAVRLRVVHVSSLVVLRTAGSLPEPIDEESALEPSPGRRGTYTQAKVAAEQLGRDAATRQDVVIVRPGLVVTAGSQMPPAVGWQRGRWVVLAGDGDARLPVVDPEDVASGLILAAEQLPTGGVLHLVDPASPSRRDLLQRLTRDQRAFKPIAVGPMLAMLAKVVCASNLPPLADSAYRLLSAATPHQWSSARAVGLGWKPRGWA